MAQRTVVELVDDLTGEEIADGKGRTVRFACDGTSYEIDLSAKHLEEFIQVLDPYITAGRGLGAPQRRSSNSSSGKPNFDPAAVRAWAKQEGIEVSDRGRVAASVVDQYHAAGF